MFSVLQSDWPDFVSTTWFRVLVTILALVAALLVKRIWDALSLYHISKIVTCCGRNADHCLCGYTGPCQATAAGAHVTVYVAKEIVTMDPSWPSAKAVAVQDGRILSVGQSVEDLEMWIRRPGVTHTIDESFKDAVMVPGFIEQHNHPLIGGTALSLPCIAFRDTPTPFGEALPGCKNKQEVLNRLMKLKENLTGPDEDLLAWGWDSVALGGHATRHDLDQVDTTRCVIIWDCSLHFGYLNTFAIKKCNLTPAKHSYIKGVGLDDSGELNGQLLGNIALKLAMPLISKIMHPGRALRSMNYITEMARQNGITTCCELMHGGASLPLEGALYRHFFNHESTPMRCVVVCDAEKVLMSCLGSAWWATSWLKRQQMESSEKLIFNNGIKFFTDDAFLGLSMQLAYPGYVDGKKHKGLWNCGEPGAKYVAKMLPWWKAGCRIHVHSNGEAAQDATCEALEGLHTIWPRFNHRFCFEHYGMSSMHIHRRLYNLGATAAVNSYYVYHRGEINAPAVGKDRAFAAARLGTIVQAGVPLALHTDTPVAPPQPLEELWIAVNRVSDDGKKMCEAECVTVYQAMKMKTVDAAYVHGLDSLLGSIEAGKFADFTILDNNPLTVPSLEIRSIKVLATVVGGVKYMSVARECKVPEPPVGLAGPLLWLFGATAKSECMRRFWWRLASWAGCNGPVNPPAGAQVEVELEEQQPGSRASPLLAKSEDIGSDFTGIAPGGDGRGRD